MNSWISLCNVHREDITLLKEMVDQSRFHTWFGGFIKTLAPCLEVPMFAAARVVISCITGDACSLHSAISTIPWTMKPSPLLVIHLILF